MPTLTPLGMRSRVLPELALPAGAGGAQLGVEHRHLERGLRHLMALEARQRRRHVGGRPDARRHHRRPEVLADDQRRTVDELRRVGRLVRGDALAPALAGIGGDVQQQDVALRLDAEAGAERRDEVERDPP